MSLDQTSRIMFDAEGNEYDVFWDNDVKHFIKDIKEEIIDLRKYGFTYDQGVIAWKLFNELIDKKAGPKLINDVDHAKVEGDEQ